ncbi:MAG TPA: hypothetical protein VF139_19325 [Candidatus Polarisedimenticolaceae bacterium]
MRKALACGCAFLAARAAVAADLPLAERLRTFQPVADVGHVVARPFRLDDDGRRRVTAVAAATFTAYAARHAVRDAIWDGPGGHRSELAENARDLLGKGATAPVLALGFAAASAFTRDARERRTAAMLLESAALSYAAAGLGSFVLAAERPSDGDDVDFLRFGGHGISADVALAASIVPPIRRTYLMPRPGESRRAAFARRLAAGALYAGVALVGVQRMDSDAHWLPDVVLGAATGLVVGGGVCDARGLRGARFGPVAPGGLGFSWSWGDRRPARVRAAPESGTTGSRTSA